MNISNKEMFNTQDLAETRSIETGHVYISIYM